MNERFTSANMSTTKKNVIKEDEKENINNKKVASTEDSNNIFVIAISAIVSLIIMGIIAYILL